MFLPLYFHAESLNKTYIFNEQRHLGCQQTGNSKFKRGAQGYPGQRMCVPTSFEKFISDEFDQEKSTLLNFLSIAN